MLSLRIIKMLNSVDRCILYIHGIVLPFPELEYLDVMYAAAILLL